jgi:hypothetical protein
LLCESKIEASVLEGIYASWIFLCYIDEFYASLILSIFLYFMCRLRWFSAAIMAVAESVQQARPADYVTG